MLGPIFESFAGCVAGIGAPRRPQAAPSELTKSRQPQQMNDAQR
jgi:hypothetical protein